MNNELVTHKLREILNKCKKINFELEVKEELKGAFKEIELYLLDDYMKEEILLLEASVIGMLSKEAYLDEKAKAKAFYPFAKIINRDFPAFKYSFYLAKRALEIFDRDKVKERIPGELARWENMERERLRNTILTHEPPFEKEYITKIQEDLEQKLEIERAKMKEVLENFEEYDAVITTHAHAKSSASLYYTLDLSENNNEKVKYKKKDTHLRSSAPNLLWFKDERPFSQLRANDKISRIIRTHTPYCGTIYIKRREDV